MVPDSAKIDSNHATVSYCMPRYTKTLHLRSHFYGSSSPPGEIPSMHAPQLKVVFKA